jgi:hypothetical protein
MTIQAATQLGTLQVASQLEGIEKCAAFTYNFPQGDLMLGSPNDFHTFENFSLKKRGEGESICIHIGHL